MNAYDEGLQNRFDRVSKQLDDEQRRAANTYKMDRQKVLDQQADADRILALGDDARKRQAEADLAKRQAQLRGLSALKAATASGMKPGEAVRALGPAGLKVFGDTFGDMASFANMIAEDPKFIDAQIAGLTGDAKAKRVFKQEFVQKPDGTKGMLLTFDDGTSQFSDEYQDMPGKGSTGKAWADKAGNVRDAAGNIIDTIDPDQVDAFNFSGARGTARGTGAGEADVDDLPWTASQARDARAAISIAAQKFNNFTTAIDDAMSKVDWTSAGLAAHLKGIGGAPANLASTLNTVKANIGLDELLKLKAAGGTLGQVTQAEHELLQGLIADLEQTQDPAQLRKKLAYIKTQAQNSWQRVKAVYDETVAARSQPGGAAPDPQSQAPAPKASAKYYED